MSLQVAWPLFFNEYLTLLSLSLSFKQCNENITQVGSVVWYLLSEIRCATVYDYARRQKAEDPERKVSDYNVNVLVSCLHSE